MEVSVANWLRGAFLACLLLPAAHAEPANDMPGMPEVRVIAERLYSNFDKKVQQTIAPQTIEPDPSPVPVVRGVKDGGIAKVRFSQAAVDLVNRVSLALAINKIERGYLSSYLARLAQQKDGEPLPELDRLDNPRYRKLDVVNDHLSNFNQIAGTLISIALSQAQHGATGESSPNADQWINALREGARNAVACAFGIEGSADFYDALEKLPARPAWVDRFLPNGVKARRVRKELEKASRAVLQE